MYRRGARRWRKLYRVNGHLFQAKRFSRVSTYIHTVYIVCLYTGAETVVRTVYGSSEGFEVKVGMGSW